MSTSCSGTYSYKLSPTRTTAMGRCRLRMAEYETRRRGDRFADACVTERDTSWVGEPSESIIKLDLLSFRILSQVEVMTSRLCGILIKSFDFILCPIFAVTSITFQQDNAGAHTVSAPMEFLQQHIRFIALSVALLRIGATLPMAFINRFIHYIYRRCMYVVNPRGEGGAHESLTRNAPTNDCMLYLLLGTMRKLCLASVEHVCKKQLYWMIPLVYSFVHVCFLTIHRHRQQTIIKH